MNALRAALGMSNTGGGYTPPDTRNTGDILTDSVACGFQSLDSMFTQLGAYHDTAADIESIPGLQWLYDSGVTDGVQFIGTAIKAVWKAITGIIKWVGKQMKRFWKWVFGGKTAGGNGTAGSKFEKEGPKKVQYDIAKVYVETDKWKVLAEEAIDGKDASLDELFTAVHGYSKLSLPDTEHATAKEKLKNNLEYFKDGAKYTVSIPADHAVLKQYHSTLLASGIDVDPDVDTAGFTYVGRGPTPRVLAIVSKADANYLTDLASIDGKEEELRVIGNTLLEAVEAELTAKGYKRKGVRAGMGDYTHPAGGVEYRTYNTTNLIGLRVQWSENDDNAVLELPLTTGTMGPGYLYGTDAVKKIIAGFDTLKESIDHVGKLAEKAVGHIKGWKESEKLGTNIAKLVMDKVKADNLAATNYVKTATVQIKAVAVLLAIAALTN